MSFWMPGSYAGIGGTGMTRTTACVSWASLIPAPGLGVRQVLSDNVGTWLMGAGIFRFKDWDTPVGDVSCCSCLPILLMFALRQGNICSPGWSLPQHPSALASPVLTIQGYTVTHGWDNQVFYSLWIHKKGKPRPKAAESGSWGDAACWW